jgi:uncharacterized metal-binding protein (TIGR02443 family)
MIKKRFIAGATCPSCSSLDSIYVLSEKGSETMLCTECNHSEQSKGVASKKPAQASPDGIIGWFKPDAG